MYSKRLKTSLTHNILVLEVYTLTILLRKGKSYIPLVIMRIIANKQMKSDDK
jgi:hypothetical protein